MLCAWVSDGEQCSEPAETYRNIPLCPEHQHEQVRRFGSTARQAARLHGLSSFPGFCYFALLPDSTIKIGYSNTEELLSKRFKDLSREYGAPVVKLAVIQGGFVAEAVMHENFKDDRLPGVGERFKYSPDMARFIAEANS